MKALLMKDLRTLKNEIKPVYEQLIIKHDNPDYKFTAKQKEIYDACYDGMKLSDARKLSVSIVKKLTDNKLFEIIEKPREYKSQLSINSESFKKLTEDQKEVYEGLINSDKPMNLLFGVTGAGKTEVYLHLARKYLEEENIRAQQIASGEDEIMDEEMELEEEDELSDEELDEKLRELNL